MLFNSALISNVLFASIVLADRRREHLQSHILSRVEKSSISAASEDVENSINWAGAVWTEVDGTFSFVTGTFTVPLPNGESGAIASAWVGIDGDTCNGGLLQTGVDFNPGGNGEASYDAWYEWYPDFAYYFTDVSISAGDVIRINATALSAMSGLATVENLNNGQSQKVELHSDYALCGQSAEWIIEDPADAYGDLMPFANFGTVTFHDALATGTGTYMPDGAAIVNIQQNGDILTSVSTDGSCVTITYV